MMTPAPSEHHRGDWSDPADQVTGLTLTPRSTVWELSGGYVRDMACGPELTLGKQFTLSSGKS